MGGEHEGGQADRDLWNDVHATALSIEYEWVNEYDYLFTFLVLCSLSCVVFLQGDFSNFITVIHVFVLSHPSMLPQHMWSSSDISGSMLSVLTSRNWIHKQCLVCIKEHGGKGPSRSIIWTFTRKIAFVYKQCAIRARRGIEINLLVLLTLVIDVSGQLHAAVSDILNAPQIWGWVGTRCGGKKEHSCPSQESNPDCSAHSQSLYWMSCSSSLIGNFVF